LHFTLWRRPNLALRTTYEEQTAPLLNHFFPPDQIKSVDAGLPAINALAQVIEAIVGNSPIPANEPRKAHGDKIQ